MLNPKSYSYTISDKKKVRLAQIVRYLNSYKKKLLNEKNYPNPGDKLEDWVDHYGHSYATTLHPVQDFVVSRVLQLKVKSVADIGSGPGLISKYIYARGLEENNQIELNCIENSKIRVALMRENFKSSSTIFPPVLDVPANIFHSDASKIPLKDQSVDLAFTCTVLQHLPYPYSAKVVEEIARVSSKYVLHVEGFHSDGVIRTRRSKLAKFLTRRELQLPALPYVYDSLGFDTIEFSTGDFPYQSEYRYYIYLGVRRAKG